MRLEERADAGVALGDARTFVERRRRRRATARSRSRARCRRATRGGRIAAAKRLRRPVVAEEFALLASRHREREGVAQERPVERQARARSGSSASPIAAAASTRAASATVSAKIDTQSSERHAGTDAARRQQAARRLPADDVVEAGGHAARAGGVGAEREVHEAVRDRDRGTGARAAGDVARVERVGHRAVRRARADEAGRELVEVGLADDDRARGFERRRPPRHAAQARTRTPGTRPSSAVRRRRCCP